MSTEPKLETPAPKPPEPSADPAPTPPAPARPRPSEPKEAKSAPPKIMSLKGFLKAAAIIAFVFILIGFAIGRWTAPEKNLAPTDLSEVSAEIASLKLAMEAGQSSATKVVELEKKLAEAEAAQKAAEVKTAETISRLEKISPLDDKSMEALREIIEIAPDKTLYQGPLTQ